MISRVLLVAFISVFLIAHGIALQKMHAIMHADTTASGAALLTGD